MYRVCSPTAEYGFFFYYCFPYNYVNCIVILFYHFHHSAQREQWFITTVIIFFIFYTAAVLAGTKPIVKFVFFFFFSILLFSFRIWPPTITYNLFNRSTHADISRRFTFRNTRDVFWFSINPNQLDVLNLSAPISNADLSRYPGRGGWTHSV